MIRLFLLAKASGIAARLDGLKGGAVNKNVHVVPSGIGWVVEVDGEAASHVYPDRREAMKVGRRLARARSVEYVLHGPDGRVRQRDNYGRDPFPAGR